MVGDDIEALGFSTGDYLDGCVPVRLQTIGPRSTTISMINSPALRVRWNRRWSVFIIIGFAVVLSMCLAMTWAAWLQHWVLFAFTSAFSVLMAMGLLQGIRLLKDPPLMLSADTRGVVTYLNGGDYGAEGYEIRWPDVVAISQVTRLTPGGGSTRVRTIALQLKPGHEAPSRVSAGGSDDPLTVHLDASSGDLRSDALFDALVRLRG